MSDLRPMVIGDLDPGTGKMLNSRAMTDADNLLLGSGRGVKDPLGLMISRQAGVLVAGEGDDQISLIPIANEPEKTTPDLTDEFRLQETAEGPVFKTTVGALAVALDTATFVKTDASRDFTSTPEVNNEKVALVERRQLRGAGLRGIMRMRDTQRRISLLAGRHGKSGRWRAGFQPGVLPESIDPLWDTVISGTYTGNGAGGAPVVGDSVVGTVSGWTGKILTVGAGAFTISLWLGTAAAETIAKVGSPTVTLTGVALTSGSGTTSGYADTAGRKSLRRGAGGPVYNGLGPQPIALFGGLPACWPTIPGYLNRGGWIPKGRFVDGAKITIDLVCWLNVTCPQTDNPQLSVVLAVGQNIFTLTNLTTPGASGLLQQVEFLSAVLPDTGSSTAKKFCFVKIEGYAAWHEDRTQCQFYSAEFRFDSTYWGGSGIYRTSMNRGSDNPVAPLNFVGHDFETISQHLDVRVTMLPFTPTSGVANVEFRVIHTSLES